MADDAGVRDIHVPPAANHLPGWRTVAAHRPTRSTTNPASLSSQYLSQAHGC